MFNRSETKDVFDQLLAENGITDSVRKAPPVADPDSTEPESADDAETPEARPDETGDTDTTPPTPSRARRLMKRAMAGVAILIFCAAVGLAGFFGWQVKQQHDVSATTAAALSTARTYAVTLTSIDNTKIDQNFTQVLDGATGEFKDMYSQSAAQLRQLLVDNKAVSHGDVVDAAVKSATKDKVEVLVFVDQSISNSTNPQPRIDRSRIAMTMEHIDGRWLASRVDIK